MVTLLLDISYTISVAKKTGHMDGVESLGIVVG